MPASTPTKINPEKRLPAQAAEHRVSAPEAWSSKALFGLPSKDSRAPGREITFGRAYRTREKERQVSQVTVKIGGFSDGSTKQEHWHPALDIRHGVVLLTILAIMQDRGVNLTDPVSTSAREIATRIYRSVGGKQIELVAELLRDIWWSAFRLTELNSPRPPEISRVFVKQAARERWNESKQMTETVIESVQFAEEFVRLMVDLSCGNLREVRQDVLCAMSSDLAQAIYLFLPAAAHHHTQQDPFRIRLTTLFTQVGMTKIPQAKSKRAEIMTKKRPGSLSVLEQLNAPMLTGNMCVALELTKDLTDWNLLAWCEREERANPAGESNGTGSGNHKLLECWVKSGRDPQQFWRLAPLQLEEYDQTQLRAAGVTIESCEDFLCRAKGIVDPDVFKSRIGDIRVARASLSNPTGALIGALCQAVLKGLVRNV